MENWHIKYWKCTPHSSTQVLHICVCIYIYMCNNEEFPVVHIKVNVSSTDCSASHHQLKRKSLHPYKAKKPACSCSSFLEFHLPWVKWPPTLILQEQTRILSDAAEGGASHRFLELTMTWNNSATICNCQSWNPGKLKGVWCPSCPEETEDTIPTNLTI